MNDEEYLFNLTASERKRNGLGTFNEVRQGGRNVRLPSDKLSRKELAKMSEECKTYPMNAPVAWATFKTWPADIRREYFKTLDERYSPTAQMYAEMFGTSAWCVYDMRKTLKYPLGRTAKKEHGDWANFASTTQPAEIQPAEVKAELNNAENIAALLRLLQGTGAKLTIEVTL